MSCAIETKLTKIWATPFIDLNELSCVPEIYIGLLRVERGNNINKYDFVHNLASTLLSDVYNDNKAKWKKSKKEEKKVLGDAMQEMKKYEKRKKKECANEK